MPTQDCILSTIDHIFDAIDSGSFDNVTAHWAQVGEEIRTNAGSSYPNSNTLVAASIEELCNSFTSFTHLSSNLEHCLSGLSECLSQQPEDDIFSLPNPLSANHPPYVKPASEWLLDNLHNPFPPAEFCEYLSTAHGYPRTDVDAWFNEARKRIGWSTIRERYFGSRKEMVDAASSFFLDHVTSGQLGNEFLRMAGKAKDLYSRRLVKSELRQKLDRRVKNMFHTRFELMKASLPGKLITCSKPCNESKRPFNHAYTPVLEKYFEFNQKPSAADRVAMAEKSGMSARQIEVWFQNRRRRAKQQFGDKLNARRCRFSDEKLQKGLPVYLLQTAAANPVDLAERIVGAEWQVETRDLRPEKKYSSFHEPRHFPSSNVPNPLNATSPAPIPPPFKPAISISLSAQFHNVNERPTPRFPEPQWSRRPHVLQPTALPPVTKPRGRAAQLAKAGAQPEPLSEIETLTKSFEQFRIDHSGVPEEYRAYYFGQGPHLPPAATYAKDVRPPTGRHPALVVPGSREIPKGLLSPAMTPLRRKKAGLPRRTPTNPQRRRSSPSPSSASSRSLSPPSSSRTPSLTSSNTISATTSSSRSLRRRSSVSSLSSDPDSPLFSPVSLPCDLPEVAVAGADFAGERDSLLLSQEQEGMKISFPLGFEAFTEPSETVLAGMPLFEDIFHDTFVDPVTLPPATFQLTQHIP